MFMKLIQPILMSRPFERENARSGAAGERRLTFQHGVAASAIRTIEHQLRLLASPDSAQSSQTSHVRRHRRDCFFERRQAFLYLQQTVLVQRLHAGPHRDSFQ
jgi:hypothetical protein